MSGTCASWLRCVLVGVLLALPCICGRTASALRPPDASRAGVTGAACPPLAVLVPAGTDIQAVVDRAPEGSSFCLGHGTHRAQTIRPKPRQSFFGEKATILNGSRRLTGFRREGMFWVADNQNHVGQAHGECMRKAPTCNLPDAVFINDVPLVQVMDRKDLEPGEFYLGREDHRLYLANDPRGRKVEIAVARAAFEGTAPSILIANLIVEKYASAAEKGAIQARPGTDWTIRNCEVRLNSGGGIEAGTGTDVEACNIHNNGQIGITGVGNHVQIRNSRIWENNTRGFDYRWEAGGAKLAASVGVVFRGNRVDDNVGPGLWCDINSRNVLYEDNVVERNHDSGIFHEISFDAVIRHNFVAHNGVGDRHWFWGADIVVAASQHVEIYDNTVVSSSGRCGIMLIDQSRRMKGGGHYKTQDNRIYRNKLTFDGRGCSGGASDAAPDDENFRIIEAGHNEFDGNIYRIPKGSGTLSFAWGHKSVDWDEIRPMGIEPNGQLLQY